jgi:hypothetical protein
VHDPSNCPTCRALPLGGSFTDEEFADFLSQCRSDLADRQAKFQRQIEGFGQWRYDLTELTLILGTACYPITPIGSWSAEHGTWLWAWANDSLPMQAREAARAIQGLHAQTGFRVFTDEGTDASSADAEDLTALAVHELGAIGFFRSRDEERDLYLAVHTPRD